MQIRKATGVLLIIVGIAVAAVLWLRRHSPATSNPDAVATTHGAATNGMRRNPFVADGAGDRGWPFLRGPDFDGRSAEVHLADTWPSTGPPVIWTRALGQGYSAFTASEDRVFTQYQTLGGQYVICLAADTGETIWEYRYDWPYEAGGVYPGPRATPTLDGRRVYFAGPSGLVGCLTWDGQLVWQMETRKKFAGRGTDFGYSCSPVLHRGLVLLPVGGPGAAMAALDARDGSTRWQNGDDAASYLPAFPISVAGHWQVVGYFENALAAFDEEDGRLLWRRDLSQGYDEHAAWPIYVEPNLWISAPFRWGSALLNLSVVENADATEVWHSRLLSNDIFSSAFHEGAIYGFDLKDVQAKVHRPSRGVFRCVEMETGASHWETDQTGHANVLVADGKLFLFNDTGELIVARASVERYEELARASVLSGEICWTPPALDRGRLYIRNQRQAACVYIGRPDLLELAPAQQTLTIADIPHGQYHDLAGILGVEPEYAFDVPSARWLQNWFWTGLAILAGAAAIAGFSKLGLRLACKRDLSASGTWAVFWIAAFLAGAAATTPLSLWRNEFVFTWPVSVFAAFQATVFQVRLTRKEPPVIGRSWQSRTIALAFLAVCVVYYLLCRRLSLVFEWVFLSGFAAAIPVALAGRWLSRRSPGPMIYNVVFTAASFAAYFWGSVAWLWWKYPAP